MVEIYINPERQTAKGIARALPKNSQECCNFIRLPGTANSTATGSQKTDQ